MYRMWHRLELQKKQERLLQGEDYSDAESDMEFDGGFRVPAKIWKKLYRYSIGLKKRKPDIVSKVKMSDMI